MIKPLLLHRATCGAILLGGYGVWVACAHFPHSLGAARLLGSTLLSVLIFASIGALTGIALGFLGMGVSRLVKPSWRPAVGATVEMLLLLPVLLWLTLNEFVYAKTLEVVGWQTFGMIWSNPGATFEAAWEMGARYLIATVVVTGLVLAAVFRSAIRSHRRMLATAEPTPTAIPVRRSARVMSPLVAGAVALACVLVWQVQAGHGTALATVLRSAPPLRAFNLTRTLLGGGFTVHLEQPPAGPPLLSDEEYRAAMGSPRPSAPDVILIVLESVSAKSLHCYGYPRADVTPNMDALAASGVLFEHCLGTASFSSYGLVSIMTGLHMLRADANDYFYDTSFPHFSLPRAMKFAGYQTALFSSGNESFDNINRFYPPADFDRYYSHDTSGIRDQKDCMRMDDSIAVEEFERWLGAIAMRDRPLYCSFYLQSTHFNYEVPEPWASHYQPVPPYYGNGDAIIRVPADVLPLLRNQYDNAMRYADRWIGRIRAAMASAGRLDNTIIVITADHGEAFMEHGLARHGVHLWDEMIRIPLIVSPGPQAASTLGLHTGTRVADTVSAIDIAPTVAALVGIRPHPSWQGVNVLEPAYTDRDRPIFSVLQLTRWQEAVTLNGWKYIYDLTDVQPYLFDMHNDPGETDNLAERKPELAQALHAVLSDWHAAQIAYYRPSNRPFRHYIAPFEKKGDRDQGLGNRGIETTE